MRPVPFLLLLAACVEPLPEGWEDALLVTDFTQSECAGDPYEDHVVEVRAQVGSTTLELEYLNAHFRCEQDLEAYYLLDASTAEFLVRPVDMKPDEVVRCDCLYDLTFRVSGDTASLTTVHLWRQWDEYDEPSDPVPVVTLER